MLGFLIEAGFSKEPRALPEAGQSDPLAPAESPNRPGMSART